jgi:Ner family transcriptional regulator|nr:MAG TPA: winged helix-turn-helix DNA-binding protein [Caudoviricetes sp.]
MQKKAGMHREDIKAAIRKKGMSLRQLSLMNGLNRSAVTVALHRPYYYAEQVIARFLDIPASAIWPDRYDNQGNPLHQNARSHRYTPYRSDSASLKVAA